MKEQPSRVRVFIATSLDGFIAGEGDDLSWLPDEMPDPLDASAVSYEEFTSDVGAMLMGRRTFDVVRGFGVEWPYRVPVLVASHRELDEGAPEGVRRVEGPIAELVEAAREAAKGRDVYIDGGAVIRQACDAALVDEMVITMVPVALGKGHSLFGGLAAALPMKVVNVARYEGGMTQFTLRPVRRGPGGAA